LKKLKRAVEVSSRSIASNQAALVELFDDGQAKLLFHRKIWLTLGCPRIDDIGGKVHNELGLDSRVHDFKRHLLVSTLADNIFRVHQAMLTYGTNQPEL